MSDDIPEPPDLEAVTVEVRIKDDVYTHEEYTHRFMMTQRELEMSDPADMARMATEQTLDAAIRQYTRQLRGASDGR